MTPMTDNTQDGVRTMAQPSIALYRRIATGFLVLTALVVVLVAYVVLARATVVVLSKQEEVTADFVVDVSAKPGLGEVPGTVLEVSETLSQSFPSTSVVKVDAPAEGRVKITSTLFRAQTLVATTRLLTPDGTLFRIKQTVSVPANGSVEVDAFADQPGASGNVGNSTFTIPGLNPDTQRFFTVETVVPMEGGLKEMRMVTKQDVDAAEEVLREKLESMLAERLREKAKEAGGATSGEIIAFETTKRLTDVPVGAEKDAFTLTLSVKAAGVLYDESRFADQIRAKLKERLSYDRSLLSIEEASVTKAVEKVDLIAGRANVRVTAKGTSVLSPESAALDREKLVGVTVESAKTYLERIEGVSSASIKASPFWTGRMPNVADHITVEVR